MRRDSNPPALAAYLQGDRCESQIWSFPGHGSMLSPECDPEKVLRRALLSQASSSGYDHSCGLQEQGKPMSAACRRDLAALPGLRSESCGRKAIPRPMRFHDLRHTAHCSCFAPAVDAHRVPAILRHGRETTTGTSGTRAG